VYSVYVLPNSGDDYHKNLLFYLAHVSSSADSIILVGDFSFPDVCWSTLIGQSPFPNSFCDFVYEHNFSQLVECPTHVKSNILDLVLTTSESIISDLVVTEPHALISTDHHTVSFNTQHATQSEESDICMYFFKLTLRDSATTCLKVISVTEVRSIVITSLYSTSLKSVYFWAFN